MKPNRQTQILKNEPETKESGAEENAIMPKMLRYQDSRLICMNSKYLTVKPLRVIQRRLPYSVKCSFSQKGYAHSLQSFDEGSSKRWLKIVGYRLTNAVLATCDGYRSVRGWSSKMAW